LTLPVAPVDDAQERRAWLITARIVVVARRLLQPSGDVVARADPFRRVDRAVLQRGDDLRARQIDRRAAGEPQHLAADAGNAHLQAAQIRDAVYAPVEPAAGLHAGIPGRERHGIERGIKLAPQLEAPAGLEPAG